MQYNPIPLQARQARLADIFQRNQMLGQQQQLQELQGRGLLAELAAKQHEQQQMAGLRSLMQQPGFDINNPQNLQRVAAFSPKTAETLAGLVASQARAEMARAQKGKYEAETQYIPKKFGLEENNKAFRADGTPNPAYQSFQQQKARAGAARTNVNVPVNYGESFGTALGKSIAGATGTQFGDLQKQVMADNSMRPKLDAAMQLAQDPSVYQGLGANYVKDWNRAMSALGLKTVASEQELLEGIGQEQINTILNMAKGPQTEGDALRALKIVFALNKNPETNVRLIQQMQAEMDSRNALLQNMAGSINSAIQSNDPTALTRIGLEAQAATPLPKNMLTKGGQPKPDAKTRGGNAQPAKGFMHPPEIQSILDQYQ